MDPTLKPKNVDVLVENFDSFYDQKMCIRKTVNHDEEEMNNELLMNINNEERKHNLNLHSFFSFSITEPQLKVSYAYKNIYNSFLFTILLLNYDLESCYIVVLSYVDE